MLDYLGFESLESLIDATVPSNIRLKGPLSLEPSMSESEALMSLKSMVSENKVLKSFIGMGFYETLVPAVIQRNMLENPGWYTAYTPYQAEIAQGRLQSLLNFQTMVADVTGMEICNASLLDEATAAAEAMFMCYNITNMKKNKFFVDQVSVEVLVMMIPSRPIYCATVLCVNVLLPTVLHEHPPYVYVQNVHPQNIAVVRTRAAPLGIEVVVGDMQKADFSGKDISCT